MDSLRQVGVAYRQWRFTARCCPVATSNPDVYEVSQLFRCGKHVILVLLLFDVLSDTLRF